MCPGSELIHQMMKEKVDMRADPELCSINFLKINFCVLPSAIHPGFIISCQCSYFISCKPWWFSCLISHNQIKEREWFFLTSQILPSIKKNSTKMLWMRDETFSAIKLTSLEIVILGSQLSANLRRGKRAIVIIIK